MNWKRSLILFYILSFGTYVYGQKLGKKELAVFKYTYSVSGQVSKKLGSIPENFDPIGRYAVLDDKVTGCFADITYNRLINKMNNDLSCFILDAGSFGERISYDKLKYPTGSIEKVTKYGRSKYYLSITLDVKDLSNSESEIQPEIILEIHVFGNKSYMALKKYSVTISDTMAYKLEKDIVLGFIPKTKQNSPKSISALIDKAIQRIITEIKQNE